MSLTYYILYVNFVKHSFPGMEFIISVFVFPTTISTNHFIFDLCIKVKLKGSVNK